MVPIETFVEFDGDPPSQLALAYWEEDEGISGWKRFLLQIAPARILEEIVTNFLKEPEEADPNYLTFILKELIRRSVYSKRIAYTKMSFFLRQSIAGLTFPEDLQVIYKGEKIDPFDLVTEIRTAKGFDELAELERTEE